MLGRRLIGPSSAPVAELIDSSPTPLSKGLNLVRSAKLRNRAEGDARTISRSDFELRKSRIQGTRSHNKKLTGRI